MPLIGFTLWGARDYKIFNMWWFNPLMWLHTLTYFPTATMSTLYYYFGESQNDFTHLLDETSVWLIVYLSPNFGLVTHTTALMLFLLYALFSSASVTYLLLITLYAGFAAYTHFFSITEGVEVVRSVYPMWKGTKSGLLWPMLFYLTGMVDQEDRPTWRDYDEEQASEEKQDDFYDDEDPAEKESTEDEGDDEADEKEDGEDEAEVDEDAADVDADADLDTLLAFTF